MSGIKSKPVYTEIGFDTNAAHHLLIGEGAGGGSLERVIRESADTGGQAWTWPDAFQVLYVPTSNMDVSHTLWARDNGKTVAVYSQIEGLLDGLHDRLSDARMGTRLYIAGSESFLWSVMNVARGAGVDEDEVQMERCGSIARPVQCVHCKTSDPAITTTIYTCPGCGLKLFVRDHFSRRLGVYQGVCVDAEAPGEVPEIEEIQS